jgi:prepilin-type N-terminal cleavage/methylation domain-containing protein
MKMHFLKKRLTLWDETGFTLIELVLTIIIVSILGAVVSIGLSGLSTARLDQAVNKVVSDLRYAQQLAISTQSRHGMTVNSTSQYTIHRDPADTAILDPANLGSNLVVNFNTYQQGQLAGVVFTSATPYYATASPCGGTSTQIEFNSIGAPTDTNGNLLACTSTIMLSYSGNTHAITIQQNTGKLTY